MKSLVLVRLRFEFGGVPFKYLMLFSLPNLINHPYRYCKEERDPTTFSFIKKIINTFPTIEVCPNPNTNRVIFGVDPTNPVYSTTFPSPFDADIIGTLQVMYTHLGMDRAKVPP
jgi:hypothetical protein